MGSYFDKYRLLHVKQEEPYANVEQTENSILFTAEYLLLRKLNGHDVRDYSTKVLSELRHPYKGRMEWFNTPVTTHTKISHDNYTGLAVLLSLTGHGYDSLKIFSKDRLHPRDIIFYAYVKGIWWGKLLLFIPSLCMIWSCLTNYKVRGGNKILKTDGKLLTFIRCKAFGLNKTFKICDFLIKKNEKFINWHRVAYIYFKDIDHPVFKEFFRWRTR